MEAHDPLKIRYVYRTTRCHIGFYVSLNLVLKLNLRQKIFPLYPPIYSICCGVNQLVPFLRPCLNNEHKKR